MGIMGKHTGGKTKISRYTLTDAAKPFAQEKDVDSIGLNGKTTVKQTDLGWGEKALDKIVKWEGPMKFGDYQEAGIQAPTVRLVRNDTPTGDVLVLATNLLDSKVCTSEEFHDLYHQRWRIEESFNRLKSRLNIESVTGISEQAVRQDLMAKIIADKLGRIMAHEHNEQVE